MLLFKLLAFSAMSLLSGISAQGSSTCPEDWDGIAMNGVFCCPGFAIFPIPSGTAQLQTDAYCCVCDYSDKTRCGWDCTDTGICKTTVPFSATDYDRLVTSAANSIHYGGAIASNTVSATAAATAASSAAPKTGSSDNAAGPQATQMPLKYVAAAILAAL
ncbi:hypothetical protein MRS44_013244 [Fusarium solani]|uniref:uncharacterized protein n=1 Tax=Fusarium solani TaxID=169388 RepID=UPI0032C400EB|nr:hypothetical protein MRS44_013244 [Fusarium solani]